MDLRDKIQQDMTKALKEKDAARLSILRYLYAQVKDEEINAGHTKLTDEQTIKVIQNLVKKNEESLASFLEGKRDDLVEKAKMELEILNQYLPKQIDDDELRQAVEAIVAENKDITNPGQLIGKAIAKLGNKADNKRIAEMVKKVTGE